MGARRCSAAGSQLRFGERDPVPRADGERVVGLARLVGQVEAMVQDSGESDDFDWSQIQSEFDSLKDEFPS